MRARSLIRFAFGLLSVFLLLLLAQTPLWGQFTRPVTCDLYPSEPGVLLFTSVGQERTITLRGAAASPSGGTERLCPYRMQPSSYFRFTQLDGGRKLRIKLLRFQSEYGVSEPPAPEFIVFLSASDPRVELLRIPVRIRKEEGTELNGGDIGILSLGKYVYSEVIPIGQKPSLLSNQKPAFGGGSGEYRYQWQQSSIEPSLSIGDPSIGDGYDWQDVPGATDLSYAPPAQIRSAAFRRVVRQGERVSTSNVVTVYVRNPSTPNFPVDDPSPAPSVESRPSLEENHILMRTMQNEAGTVFRDRIVYHDGLGRPVQTVLSRQGGGDARKDLVSIRQYDSAGREGNEWLYTPVTATSPGGYVALSAFESSSRAFYADDAPYSTPIYEDSPLSRQVAYYGPGSLWRSAQSATHALPLGNTASGELRCALFRVSSPVSVERKGSYNPGELYVTQKKDEDGNVSYTFRDKLGQILLERQMNGSDPCDTYFVYDAFGNVRYVLPPEASARLSSDGVWADSHDVLSKYAYIYKYDGRRRCIEKKLPGNAAVQMRYDRCDRLIFVQDGVRRSREEWMFRLYDTFGRETVQGVCRMVSPPATDNTVVRTEYTGNGPLSGYRINLGLENCTVLRVNYYDDYAFLENLSSEARVNLEDRSVRGYGTVSRQTRGLRTGIRVYGVSSEKIDEISAIYYDVRGRVVQTHGNNHVSGFDDEYFYYGFTDRVLRRMLVHSSRGHVVQETYVYAYDAADRLTDVKHKVNSSGSVTLSHYIYDASGRLLEKHQGGGSAEKMRYACNVRGWLTGLRGRSFSQTLAYNADWGGLSAVNKRYNGNLSAMSWKVSGDSREREYRFIYDGLNRLTGSYYDERGVTGHVKGRFDELLTYDGGGNVVTLVRSGPLSSGGYGLTDDLVCSYTGNRLMDVSDRIPDSSVGVGATHFRDVRGNVSDYAYDENGNPLRDMNRGIASLTYNVLNLPERVTFSRGSVIENVYGYDGLNRATVYLCAGDTSRRDYAGSRIYDNGHLRFLLTEEGYVTFSGEVPRYHYYVKDHQGNNRLVLDERGVLEQVNHYYPFGGLFGAGLQSSSQPYRYNGKELERFEGLELYDYGARHYDPALGRWTTVDPSAEKYYAISPYAYCANNPVNMIDSDGRDSYLLVWFSKNNETGHAGIAVDNYKQQQIMDSKGKPILDSKGKPTYEMVKDGTMTYYDLWPNNPVGKTELQSNVKSDYSKGVIINSLSDLTTKDPTGSRSGNVSAEGRAADGIVQIGTTYTQDTKIQVYASNTANSGKAYNASSFNCSTFAESALKTVFPTLNASQYVKIPFPLNVIYKNTTVVAPNNLYNATMKLPNAKNISGPKSVVAKPYLEYYGK
ncbi:RHS repeat-associated core domain [Porphyromonas macacae]|uniref:RHS repeat-associated core domain n=2 Tax=Porphyromonas macacae TaxID=28115 RepID=A0A379DG76_9PORP|nr:RHS repeat-associated core domain [Porphyromonas macacae]